jgi:DNA-binding response OmpR family regulator
MTSRIVTKDRVIRDAPDAGPPEARLAVVPMSPDRSGGVAGSPAQGGAQRANKRLRVAVIDRDPGFTQVLSNRFAALGWDLCSLSSAVTADALAVMRLNALVVDFAVIDAYSWEEYLDRVCARLPGLAVIVCTGPASVAHRVRGLRLGADAWMTKPSHAEELIGVIEAAVRRHRRDELPQVDAATVAGEITIRRDLHQAYAGEVSLALTAREFEMLDVLFSQSDRVLRREEIYQRVWGYAVAPGDRSVDVFVRKLRQKLRAASPRWSYIHTHFGVGYRFAPEPDTEDRETGGEAASSPPAMHWRISGEHATITVSSIRCPSSQRAIDGVGSLRFPAVLTSANGCHIRTISGTL